MSVSKEEVTIIIQGPLNPRTTHLTKHYEQFGSVIFSHWSNDDKTLLPRGAVAIASNPSIDKHIHNSQNIYKQLLTTYAGLSLVKTPFVLKMRSDEYYENLFPILKASSEQKITSVNIFFRPDKFAKFHMSDHLFCCSTTLAQKAISLAMKKCENKAVFNPRNFDCAEILLTRSFLDVLEQKYSDDNSIDLMKKYYTIVDASCELGVIHWRSNSANILGNNTSLKLLCDNISDIQLL